MSKILVDKAALTRVLAALDGQPHLIRELQMTRSPAELCRDNPINKLQDDWAASHDQHVALPAERKKRVYIAGPMTGIPEHNFPAFYAAAEELQGRRWVTLNPADHGIVEGAEWGDYLRHDLAKLVSCEAIFLLPGWSKSRGAQLEVHVAMALGMQIIYQSEAEPASITGLIQDTQDAAAFRQIRQLMGYVQNATDTTVSLFQDDATRGYFVRIGDSMRGRSYGDDHSLKEAINKAARGEENGN